MIKRTKLKSRFYFLMFHKKFCKLYLFNKVLKNKGDSLFKFPSLYTSFLKTADQDKSIFFDFKIKMGK